MQTIQLNKRMESLENTIKNRPTTHFEFTGDEFITKQIEGLKTHITRQQLRKPRLG